MTTQSGQRVLIGFITLSLAALLLCGTTGTAGTSGSNSLPEKITKLEAKDLAHPRLEFSTRALADQLGVDSAVIWYKFGVRANHFAHSPKIEYCSPDTPEIRRAADSILEMMRFERPGGRSRTVYYRMIIGAYPPYPGIPLDSTDFPEGCIEHFVQVNGAMTQVGDTGTILFALRYDSTGAVAQAVVQSLSGSEELLTKALDEVWERRSSLVPPPNQWVSLRYLRSGRLPHETAAAPKPEHPLKDVTESMWQHMLDSMQLDANGRPLTCASSDSLTYPEMAHMQPPDYPRAEKYGDVEGKAKVECVVDAKGIVVLVRIAESTGNAALDQAAADAAYKCRFNPATCESTPVPCVVNFTYTFETDN